MNSRTTKAVCSLVFVAWLGVSLAALAGMSYTLWWKRDRVLYAGKTVEKQRAALLGRAGLDPGKVMEAVSRAQSWPANVHYSIKGGGENQSYVKYLLAPAIPSEVGEYRIVFGKNGVSVDPSGETPPPGLPGSRASALGWVVSLLLISGVGYGFARCLGKTRLSFPEQVAFALLLVCLLVTASRAGFGSALRGMQLTALIGCAGCLGFGVDLLRKGKVCRASRERHGPEAMQECDGPVLRTIFRGWIPACFLVLALSAALSGCLATVVVPDDWDAWAIWGPKAKVLAVGEGSLADVTHFGHADYPLLWPSVWAFSAWCSGGWEEQWSKGWGSVFLLLVAWQLGLIVRQNGGSKRMAWLAAALFSSVPKAIVVSSWGYAEPALWLFMVCGFGRLLLLREEPVVSNAVVLGALALGASLTKNDGLLFAVLAGCFLPLYAGASRMRLAVVFIAVFCLLYAPWLVWTRSVMHLGSHVTDSWSLSMEKLRITGRRILPGLRGAGRIWLDVQQWGVVLIPLLAWTVVRMFRGPAAARLAAAFPLLLLGILFSVEVMHSADIGWQVGASWDRLTLQALPLLILSGIVGRKTVHGIAGADSAPAGEGS